MDAFVTSRCRLLDMASHSHHPEECRDCCSESVNNDGGNGRKMRKVNSRRDNVNHQGLSTGRQEKCTSNLSSSSRPRSFLSSLPSSSVLMALCCFLLVSSIVPTPVNAVGETVYIRKVNGYLQLLSSETLRWFKGTVSKDPLKLMRPNLEPAVICRVWHTSEYKNCFSVCVKSHCCAVYLAFYFWTGLRGVGLVSEDQNVCNISTQEGIQGSDKYQTLSTSASRLVWKMWQRPNPPPIGAVAISFNPAKFLATDLNSTVIGYLDPTKNLGSGVFPNEESATSCLVLTEIEPERYELSDVQLKRNKGFIEEDIVLAYGRLKYELPSPSDIRRSSINSHQVDNSWSSGEEDERGGGGGGEAVQLKPESNEIGAGNLMLLGEKGKVESILSYETNTMDSWGQGYLQAKGLHTSVKLEDGSTKTIEWGIPLTQAGNLTPPLYYPCFSSHFVYTVHPRFPYFFCPDMAPEFTYGRFGTRMHHVILYSPYFFSFIVFFPLKWAPPEKKNRNSSQRKWEVYSEDVGHETKSTDTVYDFTCVPLEECLCFMFTFFSLSLQHT